MSAGIGEFSGVNRMLSGLESEGLLAATQAAYEVPSLAAWRSAELKHLRYLDFPSPLLDVGCGTGLFSQLLLKRVDCGIDKNPREIAICRNRTAIYEKVECMDAREMDFADGAFATVFANCVIEHIPELPRLLAECHRVIRPGGRMITTVPLKRIDDHLLLKSRRYARKRARQLAHVNLLSEEEWIAAFKTAGFESVNCTPYLSGASCLRWDRVDGLMCFGIGAYNIANLYRLAFRFLPSRVRTSLQAQWRRYFFDILEDDPSVNACAMMIEARV